MILVTPRATVHATIATALRKHWGGRTRPIRLTHDLHEARRVAADSVPGRDTFLVVDLEHCCSPAAPALVADVVTHVPWVYPVLVLSGHRLREQVVTFDAIKTRFPRSSIMWLDGLGGVSERDDLPAIPSRELVVASISMGRLYL